MILTYALSCGASICSLYIGRMGQRLMLWPILIMKYPEAIGFLGMFASIPWGDTNFCTSCCITAVSLAHHSKQNTSLCPTSLYSISLLSPSQVCTGGCEHWCPESLSKECHLPSYLLAWPIPREVIWDSLNLACRNPDCSLYPWLQLHHKWLEVSYNTCQSTSCNKFNNIKKKRDREKMWRGEKKWTKCKMRNILKRKVLGWKLNSVVKNTFFFSEGLEFDSFQEFTWWFSGIYN